MKFGWKSISSLSVALLFTLLALFNVSCQYDYSSPLPGIIEVRLKTVSTNIPFDPLNNFVIKVKQVDAYREDLTGVVIFEDLEATQRTTSVYNTLDFRARDSNLVMGLTYVPPGRYVGLAMSIEPSEAVIRDGYRIIPVEIPINFESILVFPQVFEVKESRTTYIKVTVDLDLTLERRANTYRYIPHYYISSIE